MPLAREDLQELAGRRAKGVVFVASELRFGFFTLITSQAVKLLLLLWKRILKILLKVHVILSAVAISDTL